MEEPDTSPRLESVFYELQALRKIYETLVLRLEANEKGIESLTQRHEKVEKILITGNGTPSLQESFRALNTKLDNFIADTEKERAKREQEDAEEKKRKEDWNNKWFWTIIGVATPATLSFIIYLVIHLVKSSP